jgi:hypothetical protein
MHHSKMSSSGDCALGLAPAPPQDGTRGCPNRRQRRLYREHPMCTERMSRSKSADGRVTTASARHGSGEKQVGKGAYPCFLRPERLAMAGCDRFLLSGGAADHEETRQEPIAYAASIGRSRDSCETAVNSQIAKSQGADEATLDPPKCRVYKSANPVSLTGAPSGNFAVRINSPPIAST